VLVECILVFFTQVSEEEGNWGSFFFIYDIKGCCCALAQKKFLSGCVQLNGNKKRERLFLLLVPSRIIAKIVIVSSEVSKA